MKKIRRQVITNNKKILIPLLLLSLSLVFNFCVSDVSAAQAGSDNVTVLSDNLTLSDVQTTSNSSSSTADNLSNSSEPKGNQTLSDPQIWRDGVPVSRSGQPAGYNWGTIQAAINAAQNGDTIMLENGATFNGNSNTRIIISKNLIFDVLGGGTATIDGGGTRWGFYISSGYTVTFNNIIFQNMYYSSNGGAIRNYGALTLNNCTLRNNRADSGGAIFNYHTLTVNNCTFTNNNATNSEGGAIYNTGTLNVNNCYFSGNNADTHSGGAIYSTNTLIIVGSTFTGNTAGYGGAIYSNGNYDGNVSVNVNNSTFTGNTAQYYAGAIYSNGVYGNASLSVNNCTFAQNTAGTSGGAIYNNGYGDNGYGGNASVSINGSSFTGNTARDSAGGAIYNAGYVDGNASVNVNNCTFAQNTAGTSGGAIFNDGSSSGNAIVNVNKCTFAQNTAQYYAGAIYNNGYDGTAKVNVNGSTFTDNTAQYYGGAIYNDGSGGGTANVVLNFNRVLNNTASTGNAIYNNAGWMDATNNWWGVNDPNFDQLMGGTVNPNSWLVLNIAANITSIMNRGSSTVTANLLYDNLGNYHDPVNGHVPDGVPVTFAGTLGSLNPISTTLLNGQAQALFTANSVGTAVINATVDSENVSTQLTVLAAASIDVANEFRTYVDPNNPDASPVTGTAKYLDNVWYVFSVDNTLGPDSTWVWVQNTVSGFTVGNYWMWKLDSGNWNIVNGAFSGGDVCLVPAGSIFYYAIPGQVTTTGSVTSTAEEVSQALYDWGDIYNPLYPDAPPYGSATVTLYIPAADLSISKSVDNVDHPGQTINYGDHVKYTIKVDNGGPNSAQNVIISDTISDLLNFDPASVTSNVAFTYSWDSVNRVFTAYLTSPLDAGATAYLYLLTQVLAHGQNVNNTANVTTSTYDPATPDVDSISFYVPQANVQITKTSNGPVNVGQTGTFTITATNNGPNDAQNVLVHDPLPTGFTYIASFGTSYNPVTGDWTIGTLASDTTATLTMSKTMTAADAGQTFTNTATETQDTYNPTPITPQTASIHVPKVNITLQKAVNVTTQNVGQNIIYTLTVSNAADADNATNVKINDLLPAYLTFVNADGSYNSTTGEWLIDTLNAGSSAILNITATVTSALAGQNVNNNATYVGADQYDTNTGYITPQISFYVPKADVGILKEFRLNLSGSSITTANYHDQVYAMIKATNKGPDDTTGVVVKDLLPAGLDYLVSYAVSHDNGTTWTWNDGSYNSANGEWTIGTLANGANYWLAVLAQVVGHNTTITNYANKTAEDTYDPTPTDEAQASLMVPPASSVYITTSAAPTNLTVGKTTVITVKVGNKGPDAANGVIASYTVPSGFEFVSLTQQAGYPTPVYNPATRTVTWNIGTMGVIDPYMHITLRAIFPGIFDNIANVITNTYDMGDKTSSVTINVQKPVVPNVNATSKKVKTIPMQNTGLPITGLILATLAVLGGLATSKRK